MKEIKLGSKVKDVVSGLEGIVTGKAEYLNGCIQYCVQPKIKNGAMVDSQWIDISQLEITGEGVIVKPKDNGGPQPNCPK